MPPILIPIYQRAAAAYELGPQGPAILAAINEIETGFGTNLNVSSAGAVGWMQFMPATWDGYGVDANGDGVEDPYNPEDAIFAAAGYLSAAGMPADTYGAIFAYNHADWYVERGARQRRLPRRRSRRAVARRRPRPAAAGAQMQPRRGLAPADPARPTCAPSRTPPPATNSASAASGRWPRSPGSSRTSAAA